jgi:hypothetical protein
VTDEEIEAVEELVARHDRLEKPRNSGVVRSFPEITQALAMAIGQAMEELRAINEGLREEPKG